MTQIHPAIMCGGSGTRLWPLSRTAKPKQLLPLASENSLLAETVARSLAIENVRAGDVTLIATASFSADLLREEARVGGAPHAQLIIEPVGKNTCATAAIAALSAQDRDPNGVVLLLSADHHIPDHAAFAAVVKQGAELAAQDYVVTLGIKPTSAHTGYGYIEPGETIAPGFKVKEFLEKPKQPKAEEFFAGGRHSWNAGIFLFRPSVFIEELTLYAPEVLACAQAAYEKAQREADVRRLDAAAWAPCPSVSIDIAIAQKTKRAAMVPAPIKWSDVGSWGALWEIGDRDGAGNVLIGDVETHNARDSYVRAHGRVIALVGVSDLVVIDTGDAIVITQRGRSEEIKALVEQLAAKGRRDVL